MRIHKFLRAVVAMLLFGALLAACGGAPPAQIAATAQSAAGSIAGTAQAVAPTVEAAAGNVAGTAQAVAPTVEAAAGNVAGTAQAVAPTVEAAAATAVTQLTGTPDK